MADAGQGGRLSQLEQRWAVQAAGRLAQLETLYLRTAALAAAVHHSRWVASQWGWAPWRELLRRARQLEEQAEQLCKRHRAARALAAFCHCRRIAAWRGVAAGACAVAAARQQRQRSLLARGMAALAHHVLWMRGLSRQHDTRLAAAALLCWREAAAEASTHDRQLEAVAAARRAQAAQRSALAAWQHGALRCRQERVVEQRREQRWKEVQGYLADHRATKQALVGAVSSVGDDHSRDCCGGAQGHSLSSESENSFDPNSTFEPNSIFYVAPRLARR